MPIRLLKVLSMFYLLGDDGYPLEQWLMTTLKSQPPGTPEYQYTNAHCSARNVVERFFGVLKSVLGVCPTNAS